MKRPARYPWPASQISFILLIALTVWTTWLLVLSPSVALTKLLDNWEVALTMTLGSMVAGATSLGGGAVAFPIFTKVLEVDPAAAKAFSLAIQSVGMGAATIVIIFNKIEVDWKIIRWGSLGGMPGIFLGLGTVSPLLSPPIIKFSFTLMLSSFAVILLATNRCARQCHTQVPIWTHREQGIALGAGFFGGIISGLIGNGIDIVMFALMVLLFRVSEKVATPTSVILMAINALVGLVLQQFVFRSFAEPALSYFLAAIPVVVVGAPLGAVLCTKLSRQAIVNSLVGLIAIELVSSLILIPLNTSIILTGMGILLVFSALSYEMTRIRHYEFPADAKHRTVSCKCIKVSRLR
ncbi:MAG: sulfite exporter TauE/SafE family protein [Cyanobacteria bacterium J06635_1]